MRKIGKFCLLAIGLIYFSGCGSDSREYEGTLSSGSSKSMGALSGDEDLSSILKEKNYSKIDIDIDKYKYNIDSGMKSYEMDMVFEDRKVTGLADCNRFSANYKVKDDELSFSKIHFELASDLATCKGFLGADEAINAFLSSTYTVAGASGDKIILDSVDFDTSVMLSH
jgi:hypothetical protein